jgi:hypothetical protein
VAVVSVVSIWNKSGALSGAEDKHILLLDSDEFDPLELFSVLLDELGDGVGVGVGDGVGES